MSTVKLTIVEPAKTTTSDINVSQCDLIHASLSLFKPLVLKSSTFDILFCFSYVLNRFDFRKNLKFIPLSSYCYDGLRRIEGEFAGALFTVHILYSQFKQNIVIPYDFFHKTKKTRPDFVGYNHSGFSIFESKGSYYRVGSKSINNGKKQLMSAKIISGPYLNQYVIATNLNANSSCNVTVKAVDPFFENKGNDINYDNAFKQYYKNIINLIRKHDGKDDGTYYACTIHLFNYDIRLGIHNSVFKSIKSGTFKFLLDKQICNSNCGTIYPDGVYIKVDKHNN